MAAERAGPLLAIFTRGCEHGRVKSRLARTVGNDIALDVHRALVVRTLEAARRSGLEAEVWLDGDADSLPAHAFAVREQPPGDLGARMLAVVADIIARDRAALVVGTDCPVLDAAYLQRAARALDHADVVLGPVEDGGYVLIGMRAPHAILFDAIPWSTSGVYEQTLKRVAAARLRHIALETLWDVDTETDWRRWRRLQQDATPDPRSSRSSR